MAMTAEDFKAKVSSWVSTFGASGVLLNDAEDQVATTLCVLIPESCVSVLIGSGGSNVSETKSATGCEISFCKNDESLHGLRKCFHKGTVSAIAQAVFVATSIIGESKSAGSGIGFVVKTEAAGAVIGKGGANLKSIREVTGCNTNFEKSNEMVPAFGGRRLTFRHPEPGQALLMSQAVYMAIRCPGFASPSQNDVRQAMSQQPFDATPDMGMGGDFGYGAAPGYGAAAAPQMAQGKRFSPYGSPPARAGGVSGVCAVHGKKRGAKNLQPHPVNPKMMICLDNDPCKGADPNIASTICATHGKKRGSQNLHPHPTSAGLFVCLEHDQCK
jgi:transcription antitermination factor NusA-like protein